MTGTGTLASSLADDLEALIVRGTLRPGEKLPSVRALHVERRLAIGTVCHALAVLEARGFVEARPRAGYFVTVRRTLSVPKAETTSRAPRRVPLPHVADDFVTASSDATLVPLGGTLLADSLVPIRHLQRIAREVLAKTTTVFTGYGPPAGDRELRKQIATRLVRIGVRATEEDIVVTSGAMNAMRLAVAVATKPGDTIAVESPTFFALLPMLRDAGLYVVEIPTDPTHGIDLDELDEVARKRRLSALVVTPSFQNPTGGCMSDAAKHELVAIARRRGFGIIEDDVYGDLYFGRSRPRPLAAIGRSAGDIFYCSSFSKTLASGLRVGFVVHRSAHESLARAKLSSTIASPPFNQAVIARFLAGGTYERHLRHLREALRQQMASATLAIARYFPARIEVTAPQGGYALWVRLPSEVDALSVYERARRDGIALLPGHVCAIEPRFASYIRLSCGHPWSDRLERGIARIGTIVRRLES
jgi:DNA-binding transcriptional MocR family regulator